MKKFLLFISAAGFTVFVNAGTYYVSETGNNSHNGTSQSPWETLQYASEQINAGDTVIVLAGEYVGFDIGWDDQNGTAVNPIVFKANPGATITSRATRTADGINIEGANYVVIDGFTITNEANTITRAGIRSVTNAGVVIKNNVIDGMGTWGIFTGFSENILIENNTISNSQDEHGIYHSNSADNPIIRGNTSFGNNGCGIHMNGDESMGGDGIISNALVERNIIYDNGNDGGSGINCDGVQNSIIRNNLLYNNHASGISLYRIDAGGSATDNLLINNTVHMAPDGNWAININSGSTGNKVFNNVLFTNHTYRGGLDCEENSLSGFQSDYNVTVNKFTTDGGDNILSLTEWQNLTSQDQHSIVAEPTDIFVNMSTDNYSLKEGCVAIDSGSSSNAPTTDIISYSRPAGNGYDIGAYEFGSTPASSMHQPNHDQVSIFPNPANHLVEIHSDFPIEKIEVYLLNGVKTHYYSGSNQMTERIFVDDFESGYYLFFIYSPTNEVVVKPIVIP